jgi:hypothetical protein
LASVVVPVRDGDGYRSAVEKLIDDARQRRRVSLAARDFAVQRTWSDVLDGFLALCRGVSGRNEILGETANKTRVEVAV